MYINFITFAGTISKKSDAVPTKDDIVDFLDEPFYVDKVVYKLEKCFDRTETVVYSADVYLIRTRDDKHV